MDMHIESNHMVLTSDPSFDPAIYRMATMDEVRIFLTNPILGSDSAWLGKDYVWELFAPTPNKETEETEEDKNESVLSPEQEDALMIESLIGADGTLAPNLFIQCSNGIIDGFGEVSTREFLIDATAIVRIDGGSMEGFIDERFSNLLIPGDDEDEDETDPADDWKIA